MGVTVPDLLTGSERGVRPSKKKLADSNADAESCSLAKGLERHLDDDAWFHRSDAFKSVTQQISTRFKEEAPDVRASFFAHIVMEILLDAALMKSDPSLCKRFYEILETFDADDVHRRSNPFLNRPSETLSKTLTRFCEVRFIEGYENDRYVLRSLIGVARRVRLKGRGLGTLDERVLDVIRESRAIVFENKDALLKAPLAD